MTSTINPVEIVGLKQAAYVMECLTKGQNGDEITRMLGGDEQLVDMWVSFLKHNQWMTETMQGWSMTVKGAMWHKRFMTAES